MAITELKDPATLENLSQIENTYLCSNPHHGLALQPHPSPWSFSWGPSRNLRIALCAYTGGKPRAEVGNKRKQELWIWELESEDRSKTSGDRWGKTYVTVSFYNGGGNMVKTPNRPTVRCKLWIKWDFLRHSFLPKITFWKKKTLTSLVNYSTFLSLPGITFQNKEKYSTQYNYSILQLEYFFLLLQMTQVCMHNAWIS